MGRLPKVEALDLRDPLVVEPAFGENWNWPTFPERVARFVAGENIAWSSRVNKAHLAMYAHLDARILVNIANFDRTMRRMGRAFRRVQWRMMPDSRWQRFLRYFGLAPQRRAL